MLPIRDTIQSKNYPIITGILIASNILIYLLQLSQGQKLNQFIVLYGLVPARYSIPEIAAHFSFDQQTVAFVSFMFLHGGFWHLLGNMWSLYIFGNNVEDKLGHLSYLVFYILCGLVSGFTHLFLNWQSQIPTIGASGAIAGVMGAYFILYPHSRILTLIPVFFFPYFVEIPAYFFLGLWFILQFIHAVGSTSQGGIAWWAHIGGFIFGIGFLKLFLMIPSSGITRQVKRTTVKKKTHHLQTIHTNGTTNSPHLYGSLIISPKESIQGTHKLVNIPWAFQKRLLKVTIPPSVTNGTSLRFQGMGRQWGAHKKGDLYLKIIIQ